jgi:hypothetical protein
MLLDWFVELGVRGMGQWPVVLEGWVRPKKSRIFDKKE